MGISNIIKNYALVSPPKAAVVPALTVGNNSGSSWLSYNGASLYVQDTKARFFASLPNGFNYRSQKYLSAPPAWVASTWYSAGHVVTNASKIYLAIVGGGNSSATAPTAVTSGPITDGAIKWLYMGVLSTSLAESMDKPTVTFAATNATTTRRYDPLLAADAGAFYFTGAPMGVGDAWGGPQGKRVLDGNQPQSAAVEWCTNAPIVSLNSEANLTTDFLYNLTINGSPLYGVGGQTCPLAKHGTAGGMILDFSALPIRNRHFRFNFLNYAMTGLRVAPQYPVWAPANPNRYRLGIEGDSTMAGADPSYAPANQMRMNRLGLMLGCDDVWSTATGATGFINVTGGSTVLQRASKMIAAAPDILYIGPINNDAGDDATYNSVTRRAAYTSYFTTMLAALPNLIIIAGGGYGTGTDATSTATTSAWQVELDMAQAVTDFNHPHVKFLPTLSDVAGRWIQGNGNVGTASTIIGNADRVIGDGNDPLHPNQRYLQEVEWREFYAITRIMHNII